MGKLVRISFLVGRLAPPALVAMALIAGPSSVAWAAGHAGGHGHAMAHAAAASGSNTGSASAAAAASIVVTLPQQQQMLPMPTPPQSQFQGSAAVAGGSVAATVMQSPMLDTALSGGGTARPDSTPGGGGSTLADCMTMWDNATHMSKVEWQAACRRTLNRLADVDRSIAVGAIKSGSHAAFAPQ
jgi:hypothetical protein